MVNSKRGGQWVNPSSFCHFTWNRASVFGSIITYHNSSAGLSSFWLWWILLSFFGGLSFSLAAADNDEEDDKDVISPSMTGRILKYSKTECKWIASAHTLAPAAFLFTEPLARVWLKISSVVWGAKEEAVPTQSHMMRKTPRKQEVTLTTASADCHYGLCRPCSEGRVVSQF